MQYYSKTIASPVGKLRLIAEDAGLAGILWEHGDARHIPVREYSQNAEHPILLKAEKELREYFARQRTSFTIVPDFIGTEFQKAVWTALSDIPFGQTRSYADIARTIGRPNAVRAVGTAIGKNPFSIIVPCHRVIGSDGTLTGFAGGLDNKKYLLDLEQAKDLLY